MSIGLTVAEVMSRDVETVEPDATVADAAARFRMGGVGSLVVVDDGAAVGIVTDTDLVGVLADGRPPASTRVVDVMSAPLHTVAPDDGIVAVVEGFREHGVSHLVVVDGEDLAGVVSTTDLSNRVPQVLHRERLRETRPDADHRFAVRAETAYEREDWAFESWATAETGVAVGDRVAFEKPLTDEDVRSFAAASGDTNRLHLEDNYAAGTRFGGRIAHGTLVSGLVSAALARLPGLTIYLSQDVSFLGPVPVGERARATCEVVESLGRDRYTLTTDVYLTDAATPLTEAPAGEQVLEGEAVVLVDEPPAGTEPEREAVEE